jgi:signal transduction histidine kinase
MAFGRSDCRAAEQVGEYPALSSEKNSLVHSLSLVRAKIAEMFLAVPVRVKIAGIMLLPVLILGFSLNYWIRTGLSDWLSWLLDSNRVRVAMQAGSRSVLLVTALAAIVSILLTYVLMLLLTQPLLELRQIVRRIGQGDLSSRARVWAHDEIGEVGREVDRMVERLAEAHQDQLDKNRRLAALNHVATAVGRDLDLDIVLDVALRSTLDVMELEQGWIFLKEPGSDRFHLASKVGLEPDEVASLQDTKGDLCLCQQSLMRGELAGRAILRECGNKTLRSNGSSGPARHISIPITARGSAFGVMNLRWLPTSVPGQEDIELLSTIGAQISEAVANAHLHATVREKEAARRVLLAALMKAQEDERLRLARELHDGAGQALTSLLVRLKAMEAPGDDRDIAGMCQDVSATIERVRSIAYRLRPAALEELGLEVALRTLAEDMTREAGLELRFDSSLGEARFPEEVETTLYRIAQEGLTNIVRHAACRSVHVELIRLPYAACLQIEDDGCGFDPNELARAGGARSLGLIGIRERAENLGGSVAVLSAPDSGTCLQVRIPILEDAR